MRYGTDYWPVFRHGIPEGWRERWRVIREFWERCHRQPLPDVGGQRDAIRETETGLGLELPGSVREGLAFLHDVTQPVQAAFSVREIAGQQVVEVRAGGSVLVISDLTQPDPHVFGLPDGWETQDGSGQFPLAETASGFALARLLRTWPGSIPFTTRESDDAEGVLVTLNRALPVKAAWGSTVFFEDQNLFIRTLRGPTTWGIILEITVFGETPTTELFSWLTEHTFEVPF
jgi:hypothetical protein